MAVWPQHATACNMKHAEPGEFGLGEGTKQAMRQAHLPSPAPGDRQRPGQPHPHRADEESKEYHH